MKWVRNLICLVISSALFLGCVGCEEKETVNNTTPMSYVKEEVDVGGFVATSKMLYENGTMYAVGFDSNESPALLTYGVDTGEYETTPLDCDGRPGNIALCDDGVAYISRRDGDSTALAVLHLPDGTEIQLAELIPSLAGTWYEVRLISCGGSLFLTGKSDCLELDTSGNIIERYTYDGQIFKLAKYSEDEFCFFLESSTGNKYYISDGGKPEPSDEFTTFFTSLGIIRAMYPGTDELLVRGDERLTACDMETLTSRAILDWVLTGFDPMRVSSVLYISDELLFVFASDVINNVTSLWRLTPGEADTGDRIEIKVSYFEDGSNDMSDAILKFNVMQDKYFAVADELGAKNREDSLLDIFDRTILTGEIGDVIVFPRDTEIDKYIKQKALADLYSFMDSDENFSRELLVDSSYLPYEQNGSLYVLARAVQISTLIGKTSNFPDGVTIDAFIELAESGKMPLADMSRDNVERVLLLAGVGDFIDTANNTCDFVSDEFISLLEFLKSLDTTSEVLYEEDDAAPYINDEVMLYETNYFGSFYEYAMFCARFGGEDFTIVGYPANEKGLTEISPSYLLAISAQSDKTDAAWDFIKFMLSGTSVVDVDRGMREIPALKSALYDCAEAESILRWYFAPNSTNYHVYIDPNEEIPEGRGMVVQIDDELLADFERFIADIRIPSATEAKVREIISEELDAYYAGAKSAADTAEVIQNRVQLYLNE